MKKKEIYALIVLVCIALVMLVVLNKNRLFSSNSSTQEIPTEEAKGDWIAVGHRGHVILYFDSGIDAKHTVEGLVGKMEIEVKNKEWHISYVDCPNHTCEKMGWMNIDSWGVPITCLPNDIIIVPKTMADTMELLP
ncbi:MAG: NusG domain II-containing protein [Solobacterium sp.]|nr:NusG domain II-containing protein [Solobacterium sp.]